MARIIQNNIYKVFWAFFRKLFRIKGDFDCGTVGLSHGKWVLFFDTAEAPANVWFNISGEGCDTTMPVCAGATTLLGASMVDNGFWLYADIRSSECEIHWFTSEF